MNVGFNNVHFVYRFLPADLDFCLFYVSVFHTNFDEKFKEAKKFVRVINSL